MNGTDLCIKIYIYIYIDIDIDIDIYIHVYWVYSTCINCYRCILGFVWIYTLYFLRPAAARLHPRIGPRTVLYYREFLNKQTKQKEVCTITIIFTNKQNKVCYC